MGFQLKNNFYYYQIRQIINNKQYANLKLHNVNEESIIKLVRIMAGTISVHIYNEETNERIDMTNSLGRPYRETDEHRIMAPYTLQFYTKTEQWHERSIFLNNVVLYTDKLNDFYNWEPELKKKNMYILKKVENDYSYYLLKEIKQTDVCLHFLANQKKDTKREEIKGKEYEIFIGKKYETLGKQVIYNGIKKGKKDNGIDLIIEDNSQLTLVQCKNWIDTNHYKLNQKDIRAFIGDCYMYLHNNTTNKKHSLHFIVSDSNIITKSAELYIKENKKLKFKVIPFEYN